MKLTVKTLKGVKFEVEVEDSSTVEQVKSVIEQAKSELPAAGMKLIHSGKVLKDTDTISNCGIKPNDFLVVMVTKAKKAAAAAPTAAAAAAAATTPDAKTPAAAPADSAETASLTTTTPAAAPTAAAAAASPPDAPARSTEPELSASAIESLTGMGFPEAEVRHCLRAAGGNPDVAVEFLTNGIPDAVSAALSQQSTSTPAAAASSTATSSTQQPASSSSAEPLQALRNHPQFDALRRLVQSNPGMLQQVLTQIGQQQPELLREINENQGLFIQMMNEPVVEAPASASSSSSTAASAQAARAGAGGARTLGSPSQLASLIQSMGNEEIQQMAAMMGLSVDQLRQTANLIGSLPEAELNQYMMQAMAAGGDMEDLMGMGMGGGGGGGGGGAQVVRLTEDEMAAVDRLTEMGFDRSEAAQAFLACDKNEAMAANLLMDSMGDGGGGGFFGGGGGGPADDNGDGNNDNGGPDDMDDDADDMYD